MHQSQQTLATSIYTVLLPGQIEVIDFPCQPGFTKFLCLILMCLLIPLPPLLAQAKTIQAEKPHVLLIFTDQQHADMMSATGNPYLHTPAMDQLAANGVVFSESYCTSPVCGPARSSIISGLMPHQTGVEWNGQSMKESVRNSGEIFRSAGYNTVWAGKWHLPESYPQQARVKNKDIKGFDLLPFWDPEQPRWFLGAETDPPLTNAVVDYLADYSEEKPLFLAVSYHNPHDICMYPRKDGWVMPNDSLLEIRHYGFNHKLPTVIGTNPGSIDSLPPLPHNHAITAGEPDFITEKRKYHDEYGVETKLANTEFDSLTWQGYLHAYHRLTEMVDLEIGKVLDALKQHGFWENTLIIFTSDHGDGAAAHKWAAKLSLYEEAAKVPMIVSWPGIKKKGRIDKTHSVSQIDILPTMLDYANIDTPVQFSGQTMRPLIENQAPEWREYTVVELADFKKDKSRKGRMIRMGAFKYNIYSTGEEQLFNIDRDPGEIQNLASEVTLQNIREQCRNSLKEWADQTNDVFALQILMR